MVRVHLQGKRGQWSSWLEAHLPFTDPLASRPFLEPKDFADQPFVSVSPTVMNLRIDAMFAAHQAAPRIVAQTPQSTVACAMVGAGMGLSIVDALQKMSPQS